jgi:hypothetical protein
MLVLVPLLVVAVVGPRVLRRSAPT